MMSRIVLMASLSGTRSPTCLAWYSTRKPPCRSRPSFHSRRRVSTVPGAAPMIGTRTATRSRKTASTPKTTTNSGAALRIAADYTGAAARPPPRLRVGSGSGDAAGPEALVGVRAAEQEEAQADQRQHPVGDVEGGQVEQEDLGRGEREEREAGLAGRSDPADQRGRERDRPDQRPGDTQRDLGLLGQLLHGSGAADPSRERVHDRDRHHVHDEGARRDERPRP